MYLPYKSLGPAIDEFGRRQHGLVTSPQLRHLGVSLRQQERRVARGELIPVRRNVLRLPGVPPGWEQMAMAAVLIGGPDTVASHFTAARLWGFTDAERPSARPSIHITDLGRITASGVTHHRSSLLPDEIGQRQGIPVTSALRTVVDIAGDPSMCADELGVIVDGALRRRLLTVPDLRATLVRRGGPGRARLDTLREVLVARSPGYEPGANDWEREMDEWWEAAGLPPACKQYRTRINGRSYIIDRAIVSLRIAVEWNGFATHGKFRSGFDRTALRQLALVEDGWAYIPVTTRTPLEAVCRAVWTAVQHRSPTPPSL
jgi:hypothetical protein